MAMDPTAFMQAMSIIAQFGAGVNPEMAPAAGAASAMAQDFTKTARQKEQTVNFADLIKQAFSQDSDVAMKIDKKGVNLSVPEVNAAMLGYGAANPAQKLAGQQGIIPPGMPAMPSMQPGGGAETTSQASEVIRKILEENQNPFLLAS